MLRRGFPYSFPLSILVISTAAVFAGSGKPGGLEYELPAWFWKTPEVVGVSFAVGYSAVYEDLQHSFDEAFNDAAWRLYTDLDCRIAGESALSHDAGGAMSLGDNFHFEVDTAGYEGFRASIARIDSFANDMIAVVIVATREVEVDQRVVPSPALPESGGISISRFITAAGVAPLYYYEASSWIEAEHRARIDLALSISSKVKSLKQGIDDISLSTTVIGTEVHFRNIQTFKRVLDKVSGHHWVFVGVRQDR